MVLVSAFLFYNGIYAAGYSMLVLAGLLIISHYAREIYELFKENHES